MTLRETFTVSGTGVHQHYYPRPFSVYGHVTALGQPISNDIATSDKRYIRIGWWAPYIIWNDGSGADYNAIGVPNWIEFEHFSWTQTDCYPGGIDGIRYTLLPGVTVRFMIDDNS